MFRILSFLVFLAVTTASPGRTHEFWIEPARYQVESNAPLIADFRNGEKFKGVALAYFETRTQRYELIHGGKSHPVEGRMGDVPALQTIAPDDGLVVIVHETTRSTLTYKTWQKFQAFADHKDFRDIRARHLARGLPEENFTETYTRHAKALVGVGTARGHDTLTGMETEFVALSNPYTDNLDGNLPVRLFYQGKPRADAQIEIFARSEDGTVTVTTTRTDADGNAAIPVASGTEYLLDAVVLRPAPEQDKAVWESVWAAMTFRVP